MKIAISGLSGVGSSTTARQISERLGLPMSNFTFRDLAKERGISFKALQEQAVSDPSIDLELDRRLIHYINENPTCLIATDLACWLDDPKVWRRLGLEIGAQYDLKIWLEAPLAERARRMHNREGGEYKQVLAYNNQRDQDNRQRFLDLYGVDIFDHQNIDWTINSSNLSLEEVTDLIIKKISAIVNTETGIDQS